MEDEPSVRRATSRLLRRCGYTVHEAGNGQDALTQHLPQLETIDLVLTDLVMPQMGGVELVRQFRALRPGMRALFMLGYSQEALASTGDPIASLIQKPFTVTNPTIAVRRALDAEPAPPR